MEAKSKKDTLKARAKTAQTSRQIADMVQGLNSSNAVTAFERMEEKVMSLEAEAESTLQVRLTNACFGKNDNQLFLGFMLEGLSQFAQIPSVVSCWLQREILLNELNISIWCTSARFASDMELSCACGMCSASLVRTCCDGK